MQDFAAAKHFGTFFLAFIIWVVIGGILWRWLLLLSAIALGLDFFVVLIGLVVLFFLWAALVYFFWVFFTLKYTVEPDVLGIRWGFVQYRIPLAEIKVRKIQHNVLAPKKKRIFLTPGLPFRLGLILLQTPTREVIISPANQVAFLSTLYKATKLRQIRLKEFPEQVGEAAGMSISYPFVKQLQCFQDRVFVVLFVFDLFVHLGFVGFVMWAIGTLPRFTVLNYSVNWGIDTIGAREDIVVFALASFIFLVISNFMGLALYQMEKLAAYISLGFYPFVQAGLSVVMIGLLKMA